MLYAGRRVKAPKYRLGTLVMVRELPWIKGKVSKDEYREFNKSWYYRVNQKWWKESSLRKVPKRRR
jgi:hypothetical protein